MPGGSRNRLSRFLALNVCLTLLAACAHVGPPEILSDTPWQSPPSLKASGSSASGSHDTEEAGFYTARSVSKYRAKDYAGSVDDASRAIALSPQQPIAYTTRATVKL